MRNSVAAVLFVLLAAPVAQAAGPVCALLDPEKAPQAALLEAKLLADDSATWVERAAIDTVLKEQKLQALFSPQGVGERVKLGKLLKAEVLVMVRPVKGAAAPALEIVVTETAGGLRLLVRAVPVTKDTGADVAGLLAAVNDGLRKHSEKVTEVVAVPPFVSRDLEYTHEHLKGAFAKLAEAEALGRKGVVVVELDEAEAMAKELALAAPGTKLDRPAPVYLFGEYRHAGTGKDRTVALKLRAERAGKAVGKPADTTTKPGDAPGAVRVWAAGVLDALAKDDKPRPPADPKVEAGQLVARSNEFRRLGYWPETGGLIEAALLLDPSRTDLHIDMLAVTEKIVEQNWTDGRDLEGTKLALRVYARGLEHLEAFVDKGGDLARFNHPAGYGLVTQFLRPGKRLELWRNVPPENRSIVEEARRTQQEVLLRIVPAAAKRGRGAEHALIHGALCYLPAKEKYAALEKVVHQLSDLPDAGERAFEYCHLTSASVVSLVNLRGQDTPELRAFLDRLAADKNPTIRTVGERLRKKLMHDTTDPAPPSTSQAPDPTVPRLVTLRPVELAFAAADGPKVGEQIFDIVAAGPNVDVLTAGGAVFVMKQKGQPKRVWGPDPNGIMMRLRFDGRYVWAEQGQRSFGNPVLLVIDPKTEKVWEVTGAHGRPGLTPEQEKTNAAHSYLKVAPLEPGRACVAGHFARS